MLSVSILVFSIILSVLCTAAIVACALILYSIFLGLASSSIYRLQNNQHDREWDSRERFRLTDDAGVRLRTSDDTIIVIDPYFGSLGLYTEEMKYNRGERWYPLVIDIIVWIAVLIGALFIMVALCTGIYWLLLVWLIAMVVDIVRGIISCIVMFVFANTRTNSHYERLTFIAVGIFFLGLQLFHISMCLVIFAKFQRMRNKEKAIAYNAVEKSELAPDGRYPTLPSHYAYSATDPQYRREGYYQPHGQQPSSGPGSYNGHSNVGYYPPPQPLDAGSLPPRQY